MNKYFQIFKISFQQESVYKVNFIMWRFRNFVQILIAYFLWDTVFSQSSGLFFGYDRSRMLTYVFGIIVVRSLVLSSRATDVSGEVSDGSLSNYLLKPVGYFKYWITRDTANKLLNLVSGIFEFLILLIFLKPELFIQTNIFTLILFVFSIVIASLLYFTILFIVSAVPFWAPEMGWASQFLIGIVVIEFFSGAIFPLDVLPDYIARIIMLTPFPYLIYFPLQIYLGNLSMVAILKYFSISLIWLLILSVSMKSIWRGGLKAYQSLGR